MSVFTVVIIIVVIYQLIATVIKKNGTQQTPGKLPDSFKLPDRRFIKDVIQGTSRGTWREQLKQALENPSQAGSLKSTFPDDYEESMLSEETKDKYVQTEGTQGVEGTSEYVGLLGVEAYKRHEETPSEEMGRNPSGLSGVNFSLTERELVQGVMWAQILGKPRAMHPFRGPRT